MTRLSQDRLGRAVVMLRKEHFSDEEIAALLKRDLQACRAAALDYHQNERIWRWDCASIDKAVIRWAKENGRWPIARDFNYANRLPSHGVFTYHNATNHWCRRELAAVQRRGGYEAVKEARRLNRHLHFWDRMVEKANELPLNLILAIPNQTIRRDAILAIGGIAKVVEGGHGQLIQQDDYGKLWRVNYVEPNTGDWNSLFVEVVNSTPQLRPDGSVKLVRGKPVFDHYFLRVPPNMTTARQAVAWTGHFDIRFPHMATSEPTLDGRRFAGFVAQS